MVVSTNFANVCPPYCKRHPFFQGDLNADYAVRVSKFFEMYKKTLAPAVPGPDPAKPLFKGYQVN